MGCEVIDIEPRSTGQPGAAARHRSLSQLSPDSRPCKERKDGRPLSVEKLDGQAVGGHGFDSGSGELPDHAGNVRDSYKGVSTGLIGLASLENREG